MPKFIQVNRYYQDLPKEVYEIVPNPNKRCPICQLPIEALEKIHHLKYVEKWAAKDIMAFWRRRYKINSSEILFKDHFDKHMKSTEKGLEKKKARKFELMDPIVPSMDIVKETQLKTAYSQLTNMAAVYTKMIDKVLDQVSLRLDRTDNWEKELEQTPILEILERFAKLNQAAREQVKDIAALNRPKVLVTNFLQSALNTIVNEMSTLFGDTCLNLQVEVTKSLKEKGIDVDKMLTQQTFINIFQPVAIQYRERMKDIMRTQMSAATAALAEMEKIV